MMRCRCWACWERLEGGDCPDALQLTSQLTDTSKAEHRQAYREQSWRVQEVRDGVLHMLGVLGRTWKEVAPLLQDAVDHQERKTNPHSNTPPPMSLQKANL